MHAPQQAVDAGRQQLDLHRLHQVGIRSLAEPPHLFVDRAMPGQHDDPHTGKQRMHGLGDAEPVGVGQAHVQDHHVRPTYFQRLIQICRSTEAGNGETIVPKTWHHHFLAHLDIVLEHEDVG
jgi:hypothetical protein